MFTWLLYNTLCALPLAALALLARRFRRATPTLEHVLWLIVVVRLVLPPLPSLAGAPAVADAAVPALVSSAAPTVGDAVVAWMTRALGRGWSTWLELAALGLFVAFLLFLAVRELVRVRRVDREVRAALPPPEELQQHVRAVAARLGVQAPRVRVLGTSATPFVWSVRGPVLVLPAGGGLPTETVLAHELAHLRRLDHWTCWPELVAGIFHFWNPLFWIARRRLRLAAELSCDDWVVRHFPGDRRTYASALVDAVERASAGALVPRAVHAVGADPRDFEERLRHVLGEWSGIRAPRAALFLALVVGAASLPGAAAPSLASFRGVLPALPSGADRAYRASLRERALERLRTDPADGAAQADLGLALLLLGERAEALRAFQRQIELGHEVPKGLYNSACVHALDGRAEAALQCLERAQALGLPVRDYVDQDPDLASLRGHPRFQELAGGGR